MSDVVGRVIPVERKSNDEMLKTIVGDLAQIFRLRKELKNCRDELCLKCGNYNEAHNGACDDCRYRNGGEWSVDLNEQH